MWNNRQSQMHKMPKVIMTTSRRQKYCRHEKFDISWRTNNNHSSTTLDSILGLVEDGKIYFSLYLPHYKKKNEKSFSSENSLKGYTPTDSLAQQKFSRKFYALSIIQWLVLPAPSFPRFLKYLISKENSSIKKFFLFNIKFMEGII